MPTYCYVNDDTGEAIEEQFPIGQAPENIARDGLTFRRDFTAEQSGIAGSRATYPFASDAAGCHPTQVREFEENSRTLGVPTHFTSDGRAMFESRTHRNRYLKAAGLRDRSAGYGDHAGS